MSVSILKSIGNTPIEIIDGIYCKLEYRNPSGSIKDRLAQYIVQKAEKTRELKKGYTIIVASSGNTGIAFSLLGAIKGYKVTVVIPKGLSQERIAIMKAYGTKIVRVKKFCFSCAVQKADSLAKKAKTYRPQQFENEWNIEENILLGKELVSQVPKLTSFVAGVGTGGTIIGVGKILKQRNPKVQIMAIQPKECKIFGEHGFGTSFVCSPHGIEGIADGFLPPIVQQNKEIIDNVITISTEEAVNATKYLSKRGYFVGISSGANFAAAKKLQKTTKRIATVFPDSGDRYISEGIFR